MPPSFDVRLDDLTGARVESREAAQDSDSILAGSPSELRVNKSPTRQNQRYGDDASPTPHSPAKVARRAGSQGYSPPQPWAPTTKAAGDDASPARQSQHHGDGAWSTHPVLGDERTFYIETFGCQMNVHDSEKVAGVLLGRGYQQVETPDAAQLVFFNTCSIREKAAQKVFGRLGDVKAAQKAGKIIGVLGCVAQQEGERIFERAPWVSLVCGSASYRNLPEMLVQIQAGKQRVTGLDDRETDECFETEFTARRNPHRGYITIIEGCDKFCSYCVVPFTRGKERSRSSDSVLAEARQMADLGYSEIQLLGQIVN